MKYDPEAIARAKLRDHFPLYAAHALKIRTKDGAVERLELNGAQKLIHARMEAQRKRTGKVRAIVLKGRQQGCSTYVEGRFYWRVTHRRGVRAFVLAHEQEATNNLFEMASRYHEHCPAEIKPTTGAANAKELHFESLDSGYKVGTAGSKGVGRSGTVQYFHGSEVAYWPNAEEHAAGVMQSVPDAPDTEIILESTANGLGNWFYQQWRKAVGGEGEYEAIFVPWFLQTEYRKPAPPGFTRLEEESELVQLFGLDDEQLQWRRIKVSELGSIEKFRQEYPCTADEAFQTNVEQAVIPIGLVRAAVARDITPSPGRRVIWGVDVARSLTGDRTTLAKRWGTHLIEPVKWWRIDDTMKIAGTIYAEYCAAEMKPDSICVDVIGYGAGVADRLAEMGVPCSGINVAESPSIDEDLYMRLRDELWFSARTWFEDRRCSVVNDEALFAELTSVLFGYTSNGKRKVESKDEMKKRLSSSPDLADAFCLTFAASDLKASTASYIPAMHYDS